MPHLARFCYIIRGMVKLGRFGAYCKAMDALLTGRKVRAFAFLGGNAYACSVGKHETLLFLLGSTQSIYVTDSEVKGAKSDQFLFALKKHLSEGRITRISQLGGDRIMDISLTGMDEVYHESDYHLIAECLPGHGNLILTDDGYSIISASSYVAERLIAKGAKYLPPESHPQVEIDESEFDLQDFFDSERAQEEKRKQDATKKLLSPFIKKCKTRIKTLERKLLMLSKDQEAATAHLSDKYKADYLLTNLDTIAEGSESFDYFGEECPLDPKLSIPKNAERLYKSAKKAKKTIEEVKLNLDKAKGELEEQQSFLSLLQSVSRQGAEALLSQLSESKKERVSPSIYPYAAYRGETCYLIGHSASSNSFLSFVYDTDPTHYWLHVKGTHGSHVMIRKANPTDEEITLGCELALLSSNLSSGEVIYCPHKNIRRGKANGQVILGEYRSAYIRKVSDGAKRIYQSREKAK